MNGISLKCSTGDILSFDGPWGSWGRMSSNCSDGFTGAKVKIEGKQVKYDFLAMLVKIRLDPQLGFEIFFLLFHLIK